MEQNTDNKSLDKKLPEKRILGYNINNSFIGALLLMIFGFTFATVLLAITFKPSALHVPNNFEECSKLRNSVIQSDNPRICVTKDGMRFPETTTSTTPLTAISWQRYINTKHNYNIHHPNTWSLRESSDVETLSTATFQQLSPAREGSKVLLVSSQIIIKATPRLASDEDKSLKEIILARSDNSLLSLIDPSKTAQLLLEDKLNTMTELSIGGKDALIARQDAYIDTGESILSLTLTSPTRELNETDYAIFERLVLSFGTNENLTPTPTQIISADPETACREANGTWLEEYDECEGINKVQCEEAGGNYNSCMSPCRNDPDAEVCIQSCDQVCTF